MPEEKDSSTPECPVCDDGNPCTEDYCSANTNFTCVNDMIVPCCGNNICELGERGEFDKKEYMNYQQKILDNKL